MDLFDLQSDPDETRDLAAERPLRVAGDRRSIRSQVFWVKSRPAVAGGKAILCREQCENLRTLGHLSGECP